MSRKKVILYNPTALFFDMPLALLSIGSALPQDLYDVRIIDGRVVANAHDQLLDLCKDAICLGVTALSGAPLRDALQATRKLKQAYPELPIIWGGWHPSLFPEATLAQEESIDITVQGQGEETFLELVGAFANGQSLSSISGITYRTQDENSKGFKRNPPRTLTDQDALPAINYDLINCEDYFSAKGQRQLDYISSTGCFFRCTFCADPFVFKRRWTSISAKRVADELISLKKKYNISDVNFQDETFFTYRDRSIELANRLIEKDAGLSWAATMRADQGTRMSHADFALLKQSGLRRLLIGVESGSQEMMDWLKKDIKLEQVFECAERCKELGISVQFPFIVGFPGESDASVKESFAVIKKLRAMSSAFATPIFYFKPYPGTPITTQVEKDGYEMPKTLDEWALFDFVGSVGGPWVDTQKFSKVERFKFYSRIAWSERSVLKWPFQQLARLRCKHDFYDFPAEKTILDFLKPKIELS